MRKMKNILTPVIALVAITLTLAACEPMNQPVAGDPEPSSPPTYVHQPIGVAVPAPDSEGQGNFFFVRLITRVYDNNNVEVAGFDSPQVHYLLDAETASGYPAVVYDQKNMKPGRVPVEWDHYPPIVDEQHFQELTEYTDGTWHGILAAHWSLTVTLNPGWSINCLVKDVGSGAVVSQHEVRNNGPSATRATVHCTWPYDTTVSIPQPR